MADTSTSWFRTAYEGVEAAGNFADTASLRRYREAAEAKSADQARFLRSRFPAARSIAESCCGNGRLLVALAPYFDRLRGFDIAESRIGFAAQWIADRGLSNVEVWTGDALARSPRLESAAFDIAICITGALGYFDTIRPDGASLAVREMARWTRAGGGLILELYQFPRQVGLCRREDSRTIRLWSELSPTDPFRFYLSEYAFDDATSILTHRKIFVSRDGSVDGPRTERLRVYGFDEVRALLAPWYEEITLNAGWSDRPAAADDEFLVVTARRNGRAA